MDYEEIASDYLPDSISTLIIGEAPPVNESYFYKIPKHYTKKNISKDLDASMPATIFYHYFGRLPNDSEEYGKFLECLKERSIFLIDIINENLEIKKRGKPFNYENIKKLVSAENLGKLKSRINNLMTSDTKIIFLLPTGRPYVKILQDEFQNEDFKNVHFKNWKCFRLDISEVQNF